MIKLILVLSLILAVFILDSREVINIPKTEIAPDIDGIITDGEWDNAYWHD